MQDPAGQPQTPSQARLTDPAADDVVIDPDELAAIEADLDSVEATVAETDRVLAAHADEPERAAALIDGLARRLGVPSQA